MICWFLKSLFRNFLALRLILQFFKDQKKTQGNSGKFRLIREVSGQSEKIFDSKRGNPVKLQYYKSLVSVVPWLVLFANMFLIKFWCFNDNKYFKNFNIRVAKPGILEKPVVYFNEYQRLNLITRYVSCLTHQLFTKQ